MRSNLPVFEELALAETDECVEWPYCTTKGYGQVRLNGKLVRVHRAALELRLGPPPTSKHEAAHGPCNNKRCMNYRHLSWKTRSENEADKLRDGTHNRGERTSKLTEADVLTIRRLCAEGNTQRTVARLFGVSRGAVDGITSRKSWSWLPG